MTEYGHSASISGDAGWCIHGQPYGDNWTCAACGSPPNANLPITFVRSGGPDPQLDLIIQILREIQHDLFLLRSRTAQHREPDAILRGVASFDRYLAELVTLSCADLPLAVVGAPPDEPWQSRQWQVRVTSARMVVVP